MLPLDRKDTLKDGMTDTIPGVRAVLRDLLFMWRVPSRAWPRPSRESYVREVERLRRQLREAPPDPEFEDLLAALLVVPVDSPAYFDAMTDVSDRLETDAGAGA